MFKIRFRAPLILAIVAFGCSQPVRQHGSGGGHGGTGGGGNDAGGVGGGGSSDMAVPPSTAGDDMSGPLVLTPPDKVLTAMVGQPPPTLQYAASINGATVLPSWSIDRGEIGSIGVSSGLFSGAALGGTAKITATYQGESATTTITIKLTQQQSGDPAYPPAAGGPGAGGWGGVGGDGPAPPATGTPLGTLQNGTPATDASVKLLYPYDGTVWPRGILPPLIQWDSGTHQFDAVKLQLHSNNFDYVGYFGNNATGKPVDNPSGVFRGLMIPAQVWYTLTYSNKGQGDDVTVTLTFAQSSSAFGPYTMKWHVAPGTLKGTVYYNSYGTAKVQNSGEGSCGPADANCNETKNGTQHGPPFGAATLAIKAGATEPTIVAGVSSADKSGCRVCHAVSADGNTLSTQHGDNGTAQQSLYALTMNNAETAVPLPPNGGQSYPAMFPDQTNHPMFLSNAGSMPIPVMTSSQLYSTATGTAGVLVPAQPTMPFTSFQASLPAFSGDGKHLCFIDWSRTGGMAGGDQKSLAVLDFDVMHNAFSNFRVLDTPAKGTDSYSSFMPTNDAVVFENELVSGSTNYGGDSQWGYTRYTGQGQLMWVDVATHTSHTLDAANGMGANGMPYLPTYGANHTAAGDAKLNFEPTANPVPSGGYAWVVFTSRRAYGNVATLDPYWSDPRNYSWTKPGVGYTTKKLWVAAIDLNGKPGTDPSHPAFYLPAQEIVAGNSRGFWSVDPCHKDGQSCATGDECCTGYCEPVGDGGSLQCTSQVPMCSSLYEKCMKDSDCCGAAEGISCINGYCATSGPIS
jgi:hypothetical protein